MRLQCIISNSEDKTMKNVALLLLRLLVGGLMFNHGLIKLINFEMLSAGFIDPLNIGSTMSLSLVIFAEVFCSFLIIIGLFSRLACLPIIFTMGIAAFVVHANDPFASKELALLFLGLFIVMFFAGPGRYAFDSLMAKCFRLE